MTINIHQFIRVAQAVGVELTATLTSGNYRLTARVIGDEIGEPFVAENVPDESHALYGVAMILVSSVLGRNDHAELVAQLPPEITWH